MRSLMTETIEDGYLVLHLEGEFDLSTRAAVAVSCRRLAWRRQAGGDACTMLVSSPFLQRVIEVTGYSRCVPVVLLPSGPGASRRITG
jgi:hypothetical protein